MKLAYCVNENVEAGQEGFIDKNLQLKESKWALIDKTCCYSDIYAPLHYDCHQ